MTGFHTPEQVRQMIAEQDRTKRERQFFNTWCSLYPYIERPVTQHRFDESRKWRFDFAWPSCMLAVEINGGDRINGRHNRTEGQDADNEKANTATIEGWRVLRFTGSLLDRDPIGVVNMVARALKAV